MNPEEIIKYLEMVKPTENYSHTFSVSVGNTRHFGPGSQLNKDVSTAIDFAIQSLEKQVPKKVDSEDDEKTCAVCDEDILSYYANYCENCGQKLDWGNEDE